MNPFTPGLREVSRKFGRLLIRLRLLAGDRKLSKAETELGVLGWQQVDFDPETQREVDKLQNAEREQSRLTNGSAEESQAVRMLEEQRQHAHQEYQQARSGLDVEVRALAESAATSSARLALLRKQEPEFALQLPALEREWIEVQRRYQELLGVERVTAQTRDELIHLRERNIAIPNAKADLRTGHTRHLNAIKALESELAQLGKRSEELEGRLSAMEKAFNSAAALIDQEIRTRQKRKSEIEVAASALEKLKSNPYRQIGRVLANCEIAPLNQPDALEKVVRCRREMENLHACLAASVVGSSAEEPALLWRSYLLWTALLALAGLCFVL